MSQSSLTETGIYLGVPDRDYHALRAASNSSLHIIEKQSPAHLLHQLNHPPDASAAMKHGTAIHHAILEPNIFENNYVAGPDGDKRKKEIREAWARLERQHGTDYVLRQSEYDACLSIRDRVHSHPAASALMALPGASEATVLWDDPVTGVRCKARIDRLPTDPNVGILDIKSTKDASKKAFAKSLWAYGYYTQAAHYRRGLAVLGDHRLDFTFICVEKEPPFGVAVYQIDEGSMSAGEHRLDQLLQQYAKCVTTGVWPAYPESVQSIAIPPWAFSEIDREAEGEYDHHSP